MAVLVCVHKISGWRLIKYLCDSSLQTNRDLLVMSSKDLQINQPRNTTITELPSFLHRQSSPSPIIQKSDHHRQIRPHPTPLRARTRRHPRRHLANPPVQENHGEFNYVSKRSDSLSPQNPNPRRFSSSPPTSQNPHENQNPTLETSQKSTVLTNSSAPLLHAKSIFVRSQSHSLKSGTVTLSSRNGHVMDKIIRDICNSRTKS